MSSKDGEYQTIQNLSSDSVDILQKISLVKKIALYLKELLLKITLYYLIIVVTLQTYL